MEVENTNLDLKGTSPDAGGAPPGRKQVLVATFNGGGIPAIVSTAIILARIERRVRAAGRPHFRWDKDFDMLGGSGTGGILAVLIGRFHVSLDDIIKTLKDLSSCRTESSTKFKRQSWWHRFITGGRALSARNFEDELLARLQVPVDELLYEEARDRTPVFVVSDQTKGIFKKPHTPWPPILLRSYTDQDDEYDSKTTVKDAIQSTVISSPSRRSRKSSSMISNYSCFGKPKALRRGHWDFCNPSGILVHETVSFFGYGVPFHLLLRIGTPERFRDVPPKRRHDLVEDLFARIRGLGTFTRLVVPEINDFELNDYAAIPKIIETTNEYLASEMYKEILDDVVKIIASAPS